MQGVEITESAQRFGAELVDIEVRTEDELEPIFRSSRNQGIQCMIIGSDGFFTNVSGRLAQLSLDYGIPSAFQYREFVQQGGLLSYGVDIDLAYQRAGQYLARVVKGTDPSTLPVQVMEKIKLAINMNAARRFEIAIPTALLSVADEVIE